MRSQSYGFRIAVLTSKNPTFLTRSGILAKTKITIIYGTQKLVGGEISFFTKFNSLCKFIVLYNKYTAIKIHSLTNTAY
ncbi:hypothetical protein SLW70_03255 [Flavobacterium sp. NG2]|uniref:hypothetical protein n=1 Tax=Flavobacterium sp. NG2 TaxID=3097547 RepID=UPI002A834872|nr:hypothetical protein [Flavobacterium sp. NG2]WPR72172.1 hypothetical protein SLW70_03255 [Flavobacterium sp. NG2]